MSDERELPPEYGIVSARMTGAMSVEAAFECLYRIYAPVVIGWLAVRVESSVVEDLFQDVWTVFYRRWRAWQQQPELNTPAARPVLSFLFRTVHLATKAHRRGLQAHEPIEGLDPADRRAAPHRLLERLTIGRCLEMVRTNCCPEDVEILAAKLAGVPAKEIARTLEISEPTVDHRYRNVLTYLRKELQSGRAHSSAWEGIG
jgi:DNA-directed RNA polymerase specialized sigma24 family protein